MGSRMLPPSLVPVEAAPSIGALMVGEGFHVHVAFFLQLVFVFFYMVSQWFCKDYKSFLDPKFPV